MPRFLLWAAFLMVPTTLAADARLDELKSYGDPLLAVAMAGVIDQHHTHRCAIPKKVAILGQNEYGWIYITLECEGSGDFMVQSMSKDESPTYSSATFGTSTLRKVGTQGAGSHWPKSRHPARRNETLIKSRPFNLQIG